MSAPPCLALCAAPGVDDPAALAAWAHLRAAGLSQKPTRYRLLRAAEPVDGAALRAFGEALADPIAERGQVITAATELPGATFVYVALHPGLTDDEGAAADRAWAWITGSPAPAFAATVLWAFDAALSPLERDRAVAALHNPNVHEAAAGGADFVLPARAQVALRGSGQVDELPLDDLDEAGLLALSTSRQLGLSPDELRVIQAWYRDPAVRAARAAVGLGPATDVELEVFAQTWSEHCKHKEFNARITVEDAQTGEQRVVDGLFPTTIQGPTREVCARLAARGQDFIVTVFSDNAGLVRIDADTHLALKVETHNSPSALDPYGGAITGILGCDRDALGTGRGGGRLLFNTDVLCFGQPDQSADLLPGQLHPRLVLEGVHEGVADGGNKSGVPNLGGAVVFDDRYAGKPLVFCGAAALVPRLIQGAPAWQKAMRPGQRIVSAGGRVGRDGIHGATFSSHELRSGQSAGVVQIGSPFIQKRLFDFLEEAAAQGLLAAVNDSGAGGLSSSAGELARHCGARGGLDLDTAAAPLKFPGLAPWEIFVSESQERMTLAVEPADLPALRALAEARDVELSDLGTFEDSGWLCVRDGERVVAYLDMALLHEGAPRLSLFARRSPPRVAPTPPLPGALGPLLQALLGHRDIASREAFVRAYDHEVKGKTVIKPFAGPAGRAPQDAGLIRIRHDQPRGVAVSHGIGPRFGDWDPYAMAQGAFDEAVRALVAVGARLPLHGAGPWDAFAGCDNFCVPDSVYHPTRNPDGAEKLGKLVAMAEGMAEMVRRYEVPLISGKDSMKNDLRAGGVKISVPPTLLITMVAVLPDVERAVTSEWKSAGDWIFLLGPTADELGGSALANLLGWTGGRAPTVDIDGALRRYRQMAEAHDAGLLRSCHDLSEGGLAVALAECCIGAGLGAQLRSPFTDPALWFAESHSRFLVSVSPDKAPALLALFGDDATRLGEVGGDSLLVDGVSLGALSALEAAWLRPLTAPTLAFGHDA